MQQAANSIPKNLTVHIPIKTTLNPRYTNTVRLEIAFSFCSLSCFFSTRPIVEFVWMFVLVWIRCNINANHLLMRNQQNTAKHITHQKQLVASYFVSILLCMNGCYRLCPQLSLFFLFLFPFFYRFILICEIEATSVKNEQPQNYMSLICGVCVCFSIPATQNTIRQIQIEVSEQKQSNETTGKIGKKFFVFEMREKKIYVTSRSQPNEYSERGAQCARDRNQQKKLSRIHYKFMFFS